MTRDPRVASDYGRRGTDATRRVLVELGQILGAYRDAFVVVGGGVPRLRLPDASPAHVGTLDIDLDLDPDLLEAPRYKELVELLEASGYELKRTADDLRPFQLRRRVVVDDGDPVLVLVDLLMPREAAPPKHRPPLVEQLRVQRCDGADVALRHATCIEIAGAMPDGRKNTVELRVASIPALLAMKGYALAGRDKPKDAYDIWFCIRNYPGGPAAVAAACRPLLADPSALRGFEHIVGKWTDRDDFGPATVRLFLADSAGADDLTGDQIQTDAWRQVRAFLDALEIGQKQRAADDA